MILTVTDARFAYRGRDPVFAGLGFRLESREVLCMLGPNGVGKSTLLRCLAGLAPLSGGTVSLGAAHPGRSIGFVPQSDQPVFAFDVRTIVEMGRAPHLSWTAMPGASDKEIVHRAMDRLGIFRLAGRLYPELSGGESDWTHLTPFRPGSVWPKQGASGPSDHVPRAGARQTARTSFGVSATSGSTIHRLAKMIPQWLNLPTADGAERQVDRIPHADRGDPVGIRDGDPQASRRSMAPPSA